MKNNLKSAMTLTELIVASVLVGIVTLGLIAAEQAVRMSRQSANRDSQVSSQLHAAMIRLTKDASLTTGDSSDSGIYQYSGINGNAICFRQADNDVNSYTDDTWNCWATQNSILSSCGPLLSPVTDCTGQSSSIQWITLTFDAGYTIFFSVFDNSSTPAIIPPAGATITNTNISYIQLDLKSRGNLTNSAHPVSNPEHTLTSRVNPAGLSR